MSTSSQGLIFGNGISFGYFLFPSLCYYCTFILFCPGLFFQTLGPIFSFLHFSNARPSHPGYLPWVSVSFPTACRAGREENCFQSKQQCQSRDHLAGCAAQEWITACNAQIFLHFSLSLFEGARKRCCQWLLHLETHRVEVSSQD